MQIDMDFVSDVRGLFEADLQAAGYPLLAPTGDTLKDAHRICVDHWNARVRRSESRPRTVHWSLELRAREPSLVANIRAGLAMAEAEL